MLNFQLGIDVGSSTVARGVVSLVLGYLNNLVIEMAFLIQVKTTVFLLNFFFFLSLRLIIVLSLCNACTLQRSCFCSTLLKKQDDLTPYTFIRVAFLKLMHEKYAKNDFCLVLNLPG